MEYLRRIEDSAQGLLRIINDVLGFSKIDAGRLTIEENEFDLPAVLEKTRKINSTLAKWIMPTDHKRPEV